MELVTGRAGTPHITSQQDRQKHQGVWGTGAYILKTGNNLEPVVQSSNNIQIKDGALMSQGALFSVKVGTVDEVTIANGSQGMMRKDVIVARYTYNQGTNTENAEWAVVQGTPAASNPQIPQITEGDIQEGDATVDTSVFIVTLDGINITSVDVVPELAPDIAELKALIDELNGNNKVYKYAITVKPYPAVNPDNTLTINIYKQNRMCIGYVSWLGSVSNNTSIIGEFTVPTAFCPVYNVFFSAPVVTSGTILSHGSTRFEIGTDGKLTFVTDEQGFVERRAAFAFLSNDIVPGDSYLQS